MKFFILIFGQCYNLNYDFIAILSVPQPNPTRTHRDDIICRSILCFFSVSVSVSVSAKTKTKKLKPKLL